MDCQSESIELDVRSMTDALISVFIAGPLGGFASTLHSKPLTQLNLVSCDSST